MPATTDMPTFAMGLDMRLRDALNAWQARKGRRKSRPAAAPAKAVVRGLIFDDDPLVIVMADFYYLHSIESRPDFWETWKGRPAMILLIRSWEIRDACHVDPWKAREAAHREKYPGHRLVHLANESCELSVLEAAGLDAVYCNHNALIDERVFKPREGAKAGEPREFDALYDARIARYKRHHLATRVPRLALIHYSNWQLVEPLWWQWMRFRLRRAKVLNPVRRRRALFPWPDMLNPRQVAEINNRAKVGLCLSAVEGAMLASMQYLLCGLPVVTTPSRGGRAVFFDESNSITVPPDAHAVAGAVRTLIERAPDPWAIRAGALARMAEHRGRLCAKVDRFQELHGVPPERRLSSTFAARMGNPLRDHAG